MQRGLFGEPNNPRCENVSGDVLLSHAVARAVPSALRGLASGFGMGPGVSLSLWSPKLYEDMVRPRESGDRTSGTAQWTRSYCRPKPAKNGMWQVLGLLVPVSCTCYHASTSGL